MSAPVRRFPRIRTDLKAKVFEVDNFEDCATATVYELGQGGCLIISDFFLGEGRVALIEAVLPKGTIRVVAKVLYEYVWQNRPMIGFAFEFDGEAPPLALLDYIREQLPHSATYVGGHS
ncbi:PilZ domain-containing protein [bacterium]|nr:MAG: PilZ domain-containing protein [bacterium]